MGYSDETRQAMARAVMAKKYRDAIEALMDMVHRHLIDQDGSLRPCVSSDEVGTVKLSG